MDLPKFTEEVESLLLFTEFTEFLRKDGYLDDILFLKRIIDYVAYYNSLAIQFPPNSFTSIPPSPETSLPLTKTTSFRVFSQLHSYAKVILVHYCLPSQELTSQVPPRLTLLKPVSHWTSFSRNLCLTRAHTKELELNSAIFKLSEQLTQPYSTDPFISFHPSIFKPSFNIVQSYIVETVLPSFYFRLIQNLSFRFILLFSIIGCIFLGSSLTWLIYFQKNLTKKVDATWNYYSFSKHYELYLVFFLLFFTAIFMFRQAFLKYSYFKKITVVRKEILNLQVHKYRKLTFMQQLQFSLMVSLIVTMCFIFFFSNFI